MNAPFTPPSKAEQEARELAASILAGITLPYGTDGIYSAKEWRDAAQYLTDSDDTSEMEYMIAYEEGGWEADEPVAPVASWSDADMVRMFGGYR